MIAKTAAEAPNILLGTFSVNSTPATVLFDTGATHAFISKSYAEKHRIAISSMSRPMVISSPGGKITTNSVCSRVSVNIRGIAFCTRMVVIDTESIGVILGMDTLTKWGVKIDCAARTIQLTNQSGQEVEINAHGPSGQLHNMEARPTDGI